MTTMTLDCSSCPSKLMTFTVLKIDYQKKVSFDLKIAIDSSDEVKNELQVLAQCNGCAAFNIVKILSNYGPEEILAQKTRLQFTLNPAEWLICKKWNRDFGLCLLQSHTLAFADETCPDYCPKNVETAFIEAEKAFNTGLFSSAVSGYRKTIDRAVTPLVEHMVKHKKNDMLGKKLADLKTTGLFPEAMLDYITLVKDSGNFALHDSDHDYKKSEEVAGVRKFTRILLEYIYSLPEQVKIEKEGLDSLESKS